MTKHILLLGWHPDVVDYGKWPDLTPEKLTAGLNAEEERLNARGHSAAWHLLRDAATDLPVLADRLGAGHYDVVLVGAGVRKDDAHFLTFEALINTIHRYAPKAVIAFNTNPNDTVEAVERALVRADTL